MAKPSEDATAADTPMIDASDTPEAHSNSPQYLKPLRIKLLIKTTSSDSSSKASDAHRMILQQLVSSDPAIKLFDKESVILRNNNLPAYDFSQKFDYQHLPRRHFKLVGVTHQIQSTLSFSKLVKNIQNTLSQQRVTLTVNHWPTLDVRDIGWLCNAHYYFHNRDHIQDILEKAIRNHLPVTTFPDFRLYVKTVADGKPNSNTRISTKAIHIECETQHLTRLRDIFQSLYKKLKGLPGTFVPSNLSHISDQPLL